MNYFVVGFISIVVVGIMEVVKKFLPENVNAKVTSAISSWDRNSDSVQLIIHHI